jgi:hypothetical protein
MLSFGASVTTAEQCWEKVVGDFRQLCLLRRQKKFIESDIILSSELPRAIANWSEAEDTEPAAKKSRLDAMFQTEQRRIDDACFTMDLLTDRLKGEILPAITSELTEQIRVAVLENVRATISEDVRNIVATELRKSIPTGVQAVQAPDSSSKSAPAVQSTVPAKNLLSNFAEQVRTTVAQKAYVAVLEELGRETKKPAPTRAAQAQQKPTAVVAAASKAIPARPSRVPFHEVPAVIDFVLAEEKQTLKNNYKFELSACP